MQPVGVLTSGIDSALVILYAFWLFFFGLVFYLLRENRREGYPLIDDMTGRQEKGGLIWIPSPKTFVTGNGEVHLAPDVTEVEPPVRNAVPAAPFPGSPLIPTGNPLTSGVGPASYAMRADRPDVTSTGDVKLVPMRLLTEHEIAEHDADPRGMEMIGADGMPAGVIEDVWVDRSESMVRYLEVRLDPSIAALTDVRSASAGADPIVGVTAVEVDDGRTDVVAVAAEHASGEVEAAAIAVDEATGDASVAVVTEEPSSGGAIGADAVDTVLIPINSITLAPVYGQVSTPTILAHQFADVPRLKQPDRVTLLEEDMIMAYYSAGELYATPSRSEPLL